MKLRTKNEVEQAEREYLDRVWYGRHCALAQAIYENGGKLLSGRVIDPKIWAGAEQNAVRLDEKYGEVNLPYPGEQSDFQWGVLTGRLAAMRWVLGGNWDAGT